MLLIKPLTYAKIIKRQAEVVKLADALDSKSSMGDHVRVQVPPSAPTASVLIAFESAVRTLAFYTPSNCHLLRRLADGHAFSCLKLFLTKLSKKIHLCIKRAFLQK